MGREESFRAKKWLSKCFIVAVFNDMLDVCEYCNVLSAVAVMCSDHSSAYRLHMRENIDRAFDEHESLFKMWKCSSSCSCSLSTVLIESASDSVSLENAQLSMMWMLN